MLLRGSAFVPGLLSSPVGLTNTPHVSATASALMLGSQPAPPVPPSVLPVLPVVPPVPPVPPPPWPPCPEVVAPPEKPSSYRATSRLQPAIIARAANTTPSLPVRFISPPAHSHRPVEYQNRIVT